MKNAIPMVIAVVLAAAAVFAVSKMVKTRDSVDEKQYVNVVAAVNPIPSGATITDSMLKSRRVEKSAVPAKALEASQKNRILGLKTTRAISGGDYVELDDFATGVGDLSDLVRDGEWAVPVTFADSSLVQFLQPGVEIAILGTFTVTKTITKMDGTEAPDQIKEEATSVIFPCVRILDIGNGDGIRRDIGAGGGTVIVSLTPQQAATLVAAQRTMDLYPALRHRADPASLQRRDVGMVTDKTFEELRKGLDTVTIPDGAERQ